MKKHCNFKRKNTEVIFTRTLILLVEISKKKMRINPVDLGETNGHRKRQVSLTLESLEICFFSLC
jgi:hypothetical protein